MNRTILGLDLSLSGAGVVAVAGEQVLHHATVKTPASDGLEKRIDDIWREVARTMKAHPPDWVVVEGGARGGKFVDLRTYHLAGVIRYRLWKRSITFQIVTPTELKLEATGNGRASKADMLTAARVLWPECPNHNAADAFHLARWGCDNYGLFFE